MREGSACCLRPCASVNRVTWSLQTACIYCRFLKAAHSRDRKDEQRPVCDDIMTRVKETGIVCLSFSQHAPGVWESDDVTRGLCKPLWANRGPAWWVTGISCLCQTTNNRVSIIWYLVLTSSGSETRAKQMCSSQRHKHNMSSHPSEPGSQSCSGTSAAAGTTWCDHVMRPTSSLSFWIRLIFVSQWNISPRGEIIKSTYLLVSLVCCKEEGTRVKKTGVTSSPLNKSSSIMIRYYNNDTFIQ